MNRAAGETVAPDVETSPVHGGGGAAAPRWWIAVLLLALGVQLWLLIGHGDWGRPIGLRLIGLAWVVLAVPPVHRSLWNNLERLRHPSRKLAVWIAVGVGIAAMAYLRASPPPENRPPTIGVHDEFMFRVQTEQLARFRLWMPPHPVGEFFESFYLFPTPVYAAQSFPGAPLLYVPTVWLGLPFWTGPLLAAGLVAALLYLVATELTDGVLGLVAALSFVSLGYVRAIGVAINSFAPAMAFGLAMVMAYLYWRRDGRTRWLVLLGVAAGWGAITRPAEAACWAMPVGLLMLRDLWHKPWKDWRSVTLAVVLPAAPFLLLQVVFNVGVTGRPFYPPHLLYVDRYQPGFGYVFEPLDLSKRIDSPVPQVQQYFADQVEELRRYVPGRLVELWADKRLASYRVMLVPQPLLLVFVPLAALALARDRRAWLAVAPLVLIELNYAFRRPYYSHYTLSMIPAAVLVVALGLHGLAQAFGRARAYVGCASVATATILCLLSMPQFNRLAWDFGFPHPYISAVNRALEPLADRPSIVLFPFAPGDDYMQEPVYNSEVAWPDDARVIRAHDLGGRNVRLFDYYARVQPDRRVYRFDRGTRTPVYLGTAAELAAKAHGGSVRGDESSQGRL